MTIAIGHFYLLLLTCAILYLSCAIPSTIFAISLPLQNFATFNQGMFIYHNPPHFLALFLCPSVALCIELIIQQDIKRPLQDTCLSVAFPTRQSPLCISRLISIEVFVLMNFMRFLLFLIFI